MFFDLSKQKEMMEGWERSRLVVRLREGSWFALIRLLRVDIWLTVF